MDNMWMKIGSAVLLGIMLIFIFPRARQMLKEGPKGSSDDWRAAIIPLLLVVLFVVFLMWIV